MTTTFEQRGARAALLAGQAPAGREPLQFAAALLGMQARLAAAFERLDLSGRLADDVEELLPHQRSMIESVAACAPPGLEAEAESRLTDDPTTARTRLLVVWIGDHRNYLSRALLQPYAEVLRARKLAPDRIHTRGHCPFCGAPPWIAARNGQRQLGCSLCGLEWTFNRVCCPSCFEDDPARLPIYSSEKHGNVRIEACETCRRYIKSIDLTADARPIPAVDDLVSLSLDLWAAEEGFTRIEPGLAGI